MSQVLKKEMFVHGVFAKFAGIVFLIFLNIFCRLNAAEFQFSKNGNPLGEVVTLPNADKKVILAADELALYLGRIVGRKFKRVEGDGSTGIVVATLKQFPDAEFKDLHEKLAIKNTYDGREAFAIRSELKRLLLVGASDKGAGHAVFRLLEKLGCRWFFPAPEWEVIPNNPNLKIDINIVDRPVILGRRIWYQWGFFERGKGKSISDYKAWARHNLMDSSLKVNCSHAWQNIIAQNKKIFAEHPEYIALRKPKKKKNDKTTTAVAMTRGGKHLCVSNPEVVKLCKQYADKYFKKHPNADMLSMEAADGNGYCKCANCAKFGTISNQVFFLANEVAKYVALKYPGKLVGVLAYGEHSQPPKFKLSPNIYVELTCGFIRGKYTYDELLERWPKKVSNMGFYEYYSVFQWNWDMLPGGKGADTGYLTKKIRRLNKIKAKSITAESGNNWGVHGRGYYLANRLMWNPDADPEVIFSDFYQKAFGPAAEVMRNYYERLDPKNKPLITCHLIAMALRDLDKAAKLAKGKLDILARIDHLKIYMRYEHLRWLFDHSKLKEVKKKLVEKILTHVYRSRYTYMNHWEPILKFWAKKMAKKFDEPKWITKKAPWIGAESYSKDEINKFFKDGLDYFKPVDAQRTKFSKNLVSVKIGTGKPYLISGVGGGWQGKMSQAIASVYGEPLKISVETGFIKAYRDRAPATFEFKTTSGKILASGKLTLDGKQHPLVCEVPGPGVYYLTLNDVSAWKIHTDSTLPLAIMLPNNHPHSGRCSPLYFYVPKGVKTIKYFWIGRAHSVLTPDGKLARKVEDAESGQLISVKVPDGQDGKLWKFYQFQLKRLDFLNVPNLLFRSNQMILLPAELVKKDGLNHIFVK